MHGQNKTIIKLKQSCSQQENNADKKNTLQKIHINRKYGNIHVPEFSSGRPIPCHQEQIFIYLGKFGKL